jgi:hypothetical protein
MVARRSRTLEADTTVVGRLQAVPKEGASDPGPGGPNPGPLALAVSGPLTPIG